MKNSFLGEQSPGVLLVGGEGGSCGILAGAAEVRAPTVERAAMFLDAALAGRHTDSHGRRAHLVVTLSIYQYSLDANAKGGGKIFIIICTTIPNSIDMKTNDKILCWIL